ncbi:hypothetical protein C8R46DRAFT_880338 [Mycena filopes]|nr:hypothetical protein C8R46DRAFT_880338 [Mycena filopes]
MLFDLTHDKLVFNDEIVLDTDTGRARLRLRGIIYGGQGHFTCRFIQSDGTIWFHDGITTGSSCLRESKVQDIGDRLQLHRCGEKTAAAVIYALVP